MSCNKPFDPTYMIILQLSAEVVFDSIAVKHASELDQIAQVA